MTSSRPLVSIITACFNSAKHLEEAIDSVQALNYPNIEHIIIDGGSNDGTVDIIRKRSAKIAYWVSEPDKGIGDAWNKGLAVARGEIIGTLNSDDTYDKNALEAVIKSLRPTDRTLTYGVAKIYRDSLEKGFDLYDGAFNPAAIYFGFGFVHTTCFVTRRVYEEIGGFSTRYRIAVDTDFLLRCYLKGVEFRRLDNVTFMRDGGLSQANPTEGYLEYMKQLYRHGFSKVGIARSLAWHLKHRVKKTWIGRFFK